MTRPARPSACSNIYDPDNGLEWPPQLLSEGYRLLVEDRTINAGHGMIDSIVKSWNPMFHSCYREDEEALASIPIQLMR